MSLRRFDSVRRFVLGAQPLPLACRPSSAPTTEILFQRQPPGDTEDLWALDPTTGATRRLTQGTAGSANSLAAWAPEGRRIGFVREFEDHDELYVLDSAGALPRRLFAQGPSTIVFPDWSPDGRHLLVSAGPDLWHMGWRSSRWTAPTLG